MQFPSDLLQILQALISIPYENLTKIVAFNKNISLNDVLDTPEKLYQKSSDLGAGGTCFSLTYYLKVKLDEKGYKTRFLLADHYQKKNIHCGLLLGMEDQFYLLDPGYMIYQPLLVPRAGLSLQFDLIPNKVRLNDLPEEGIWRLWTSSSNEWKRRFDFKKEKVSPEMFLDAWKQTFFFDMMAYPVLNKLEDGVQYYLQKRNLMIRNESKSEMIKLNRDNFTEKVSQIYGIMPDVTEEALAVILQKRRGFFD